jgi:STE24 endopeptidase
MTPVTLAVVALLVATEAFFTGLSLVNLRYGARTLRAESAWVAEEFGLDDPERVIDYQAAKSRLGLARRWTTLAVVLAVLLSGVPAAAVGTVEGLGLASLVGAGLAPVAEGVALLLGAVVGLTVVSWPFDAVDTFVVEERFGFNNATPGLWLRDRLVSLVVTLVVGGLVLSVVVLATVELPTLWPVAAWATYLVVSLAALVVYPRVVAPLFNDFEPVEGDLREAVEAVFDRAGFDCEQVYEMDASRRSAHANAYFVGFGRTKRVVLFDTLVDQHPAAEVQAVLAHELAHWKRGHVWRSLAAGALQVGVLLAVAGWLVDRSALYAAVGVPEAPAVGLALAALVVAPLSRVAAPLSNRLSLAHEREADDFAAEVESPDALADALERLVEENLSNPFPHPWYAAFHYTHPPVPERVRRLRGRDGEGGGGTEGDSGPGVAAG